MTARRNYFHTIALTRATCCRPPVLAATTAGPDGTSPLPTAVAPCSNAGRRPERHPPAQAQVSFRRVLPAGHFARAVPEPPKGACWTTGDRCAQTSARLLRWPGTQPSHVPRLQHYADPKAAELFSSFNQRCSPADRRQLLTSLRAGRLGDATSARNAPPTAPVASPAPAA